MLASGSMDEKLALRCEQALRTNPALAVPRGDFLQYVAEREGATHLDDLLLACAALRGVRAAHERLERDFFGELPRVLGRLRMGEDDVRELGQRLRVALLVGSDGGGPAKLHSYAGTGPLGGWLRAVATRAALSELRRPPRVEGDFDAELMGFATADDEAMASLRARHARELEEALRAAIAALPPRDRNLLRMHVIDGASIDVMGRLYGVHRATVARWLSEIRVGLASGARQRLAASPSTAEINSLARLCFSQIDLSLERLLSAPDPVTGAPPSPGSPRPPSRSVG